MYTSEDMAADYVHVLHAIGPSRVMGLSAGGLIAQHVALQAPALVEKLALVVCTHGAGADHPMFDAQVRALAPRFRSSCFVANRTGRGVDRGSGAPLSRVEPELPVCRHTRRRPLCE
jgi:pimeloyl-ACP methyl ester carboxylesterase